MRIDYLKAKHFAGIKVGTGKDKIVVDFTKNKNPLILLLGGNGKGKTSLLSILHPLRGTNDNRSPIIEGKKGYKEIHISEGSDKYEIIHTWKPNKSFIKKNGEELNENGNITTFNEIVKKELGVDEDYFKVGRLGNNVTNFINLKSSERKKFIGNFLPNIDDYLRMFDIVKNKYSAMNKELTNVSNQLGKFPELPIMEDKVKSLTQQLNQIIDGITLIEKQLAVVEFSKTQIEDKFKEAQIQISIATINSLKSEVTILENKLIKAEETINVYTNKYPNLANYDNKKIIDTIEDIDNKNKDYDIELAKLTTEYNTLVQQDTDIRKRISVTYSKIKDDVSSQIEEVEQNISKEETRFAQMEEHLADFDKRYLDYSINEFNKIKFQASKVQDMIINNIITIYNFTSFDFNLVNSYSVVAQEKEELEKEISELEDILRYIHNNKHQLDILEKRPEACKIDSCSFITNSLNFKKEYYDNKDEYEEQLERNRTRLAEDEKILEAIEEIKQFTNECDKCIQAYNDLSDSFIEGYFLKEHFTRQTFIEFLKSGVPAIEKALNVDDIYDAITLHSDLQQTQNRLNVLNERLQNLNEHQQNTEGYKVELEELNSELDIISKRMVEIGNLQKEITKKRNVGNSKKTILNQLKSSYDICETIDNELQDSLEFQKSVEDAYNKIQEYNTQIDSLRLQISNQKRLKDSIEKEKSQNEKDLNYLQVLVDKKEELDKKFDYTKLIKNALDPKQGIPLLFIDDFLQSITEKTNNLLHLAYGDEFKIEFDITEKDFFIKVHRLFSDLDDINQASQGETSMTTLSLSLSMIENMIKKYNIIYLDEIDSTLSTENRRLFISMIEKQLLDLGIEQIFIISHNNEFDSYPVDLMLFKEHGLKLDDSNETKLFLMNKNIIFNVEDQIEEDEE